MALSSPAFHTNMEWQGSRGFARKLLALFIEVFSPARMGDSVRPQAPRPLHCLHLYAEEERKGGLENAFRHPNEQHETNMSAQAALAHFEKTGRSPLSKWQTHFLVFKRDWWS